MLMVAAVVPVKLLHTVLLAGPLVGLRLVITSRGGVAVPACSAVVRSSSHSQNIAGHAKLRGKRERRAGSRIGDGIIVATHAVAPQLPECTINT
jgi:hypothetical protein